VQRLHPELWRQKNWLLRYNKAPSRTSFYTREFLTENNMTVVPYPRYFSLLPRLKLTLKSMQAVPNTPTEHDFQDAFKKCKNAGNDTYAPVGPKLVFDQMSAPVPKIMNDFVCRYGSSVEISWRFGGQNFISDSGIKISFACIPRTMQIKQDIILH
jgi:hypothetical protein